MSLCHPASRSSPWAGLTGSGKENWRGTGFERDVRRALFFVWEKRYVAYRSSSTE